MILTKQHKEGGLHFQHHANLMQLSEVAQYFF
jgi:hypothetical protein